MAIPVIDFSKLNGQERAKTMAQIANGCEEWGFFQLVNHGIPVELLNRVKNVSSECYKQEREESFSQIGYPTFVFGDYMSVYNEQKFQPKEPRFQAVTTA